ncbi:DNA internalization-related competence protein ComEC/Rec2 [Rhodohalobacter sp. 614A]|uniref:DNA internalization-related competence protein ComEC/Rec2 n=1 Tax=Rhodohalobacter sp. 614A TaxID=2908649 RepID=UPI001F2B6A56|nr:DNA internalization-related competence protein ComEC/Rec2 [Rhodohalobacter sp. 614A]
MGSRASYQFPFAAYPAVRIMLLLILGIIMANQFSPQPIHVISIFVFILVGWVLFEFILRRKWMVISSHAATVFYLVFIMSAATMIGILHHKNLSQKINEAKPIQYYEWEDVSITGEIIEAGKSSSGRKVFTVRVTETNIAEEAIWKEDYNVRLYADQNVNEKLSEGDIVDANIRLYEFPEQRNPHKFDYGDWLNSKGIVAHGELNDFLIVKEEQWWDLGSLRSTILRNAENLFHKDEASLAKALLLGYKDDLSTESKQQFARAGLSHIMAVSGLHVGFIVAPFWFLIPFMWGSKKGKWFGLIILTLLLICYAGITGFSASVSRASLMAWLLTYGRLFHKVRNSINLTALAAIILLLINPDQLFDPGFQLSFSAVFIILLVMPEAQRLIPRKYHFGWIGGLITIILVSIVVQLGLFPILINYFGEFSVVGPLSNALVIPLMTIVVPIGLILVLIGPVIPEILVLPIDYALKWIQSVATFTGGSNLSFVTLNEFSFSLFFIWLFGILLIASQRIPKIRWKMLICLLLAMNGFMFEQVIHQTEAKKLKVTFLDVGQGDAIHIQTPNNKHLLVDAGRWSPGSNSGEDVILPYLEIKGIKKLEAIFLSHPHADHIGGIVEILDHVHVDTIYQSDVEYDSNLYQSFMDLAEQKRIPVKYPQAGNIINADPSIRVFVLGPEENVYQSNPNNRSLVFKIVYGSTSILFSGDAEKEQEEMIAQRYGDFLKSDLYKVGHHASNTSSSASFIRLIGPSITVASLAFENRFGHPGTRAVSRLHEYSSQQHYTSLSGAVLFESDGKAFRRIEWKEFD